MSQEIHANYGALMAALERQGRDLLAQEISDAVQEREHARQSTARPHPPLSDRERMLIALVVIRSYTLDLRLCIEETRKMVRMETITFEKPDGTLWTPGGSIEYKRDIAKLAAAFKKIEARLSKIPEGGHGG